MCYDCPERRWPWKQQMGTIELDWRTSSSTEAPCFLHRPQENLSESTFLSQVFSAPSSSLLGHLPALSLPWRTLGIRIILGKPTPDEFVTSDQGNTLWVGFFSPAVSEEGLMIQSHRSTKVRKITQSKSRLFQGSPCRRQNRFGCGGVPM